MKDRKENPRVEFGQIENITKSLNFEKVKERNIRKLIERNEEKENKFWLEEAQKHCGQLKSLKKLCIKKYLIMLIQIFV